MADYATKKDAGIPCPTCGGTQVAKAIMAPRVKAQAAAPAPMPACAPGGCGGGGMCPMMS